MPLRRTLCAACAVAHFVHFGTYAWQPGDRIEYRRGVIAASPSVRTGFDSEEPQRQGWFRLPTVSAPVTGTASGPSGTWASFIPL